MKWRMEIVCENPPGHECVACKGKGRWEKSTWGFGSNDDDVKEYEYCKECDGAGWIKEKFDYPPGLLDIMNEAWYRYWDNVDEWNKMINKEKVDENNGK